MSTNRPIGIFDSGVGGLTVAKQIIERLPHERIVYVADQAHVPYGERSAEEIRSFALGITDFLVRGGSKLVIMACNMSSATALEAARELCPDTPVIGVVEAGARSAVREWQDGPLGVLATTGTVSTGAYTRAVARLAVEAEVIEQACPRFVPLVEDGMSESPEAEEAAREYAQPLLSAGCRVVILGCTHYPFLTSAIRKALGPDASIIDPADETAVEAAEVLRRTGVLNPLPTEASHLYCTSGDPKQFAELGERFLGRTLGGVQSIQWGSDLGVVNWQEKMVGQTTKSAR